MEDHVTHERRSYAINEREIGALINQVDVLKESLKTVQANIDITLSNRKDIDYALHDISKSFDMINSHLVNIDSKMQTLDEKLNNHIQKDVGFDVIMQTKLGKWVLGIIALIFGTFIVDIVHKIKDILWK